ncbi:hypothetical protein ACGFNX_24630 [Streptomyces sp. NPDC048723]|uniref:hypothetical protein n=1 Tax=unclassified Streptomyces TaxID=2593676 RepID=UPI00356313B3
MDQLVGFIKPLPDEDQVRVGLPRVANLVLADPSHVANRTCLLTSRLIVTARAEWGEGHRSCWRSMVARPGLAGGRYD